MSTTTQQIISQGLSSRLEGEVHTDIFSRGRYATDASVYQMMPLGVVLPRSIDDIRATLGFARGNGMPVLPRGGGTSQCGQTVNQAIVLDNTRFLNRVLSLDVAKRRCVVEPGIVLDELNRQLRPHGLWYPVDVSTGSRATIGGMAANNSCGSRSIRYGLMRDNVHAIDAMLADGNQYRFESLASNPSGSAPPAVLVEALLGLGQREAGEIDSRFPEVMRRVGGYNIDALTPGRGDINLSHLLVGSEGTLAYSNAIELRLSPLPQNKVLGVCHFPSFYSAMDSAQHLVKLGPTAVELIDRTMIELSRDIPLFRETVDRFVQGEPEAILLVEFAEDDQAENLSRLEHLKEMMADLGFSFDHPDSRGGVVEAVDRAFQSAIFEVRKSGLNIMMSMRDERKPVSFVEDCAVRLEDLAEYTDRLTEIFKKHDTMGTWYAHASVGCLHVRPVLNLRLEKDVKAMRAIAEECFDMVLQYKGSHSGEHGDGICRSEFHEKMFGSRMVENFGEVKKLFDPNGVMNPGKIVDAPKLDDRGLFRYPADYNVAEIKTVFNWSGWTGAGGGFQGAVEMCNNNGACRKLEGGVMCPSYRATRDEKHSPRGRANALRLALSGQLGAGAFSSHDMAEAMSLCVSCKACKRECPTGVDMAKMKIEVDAARYEKYGASLHDRLVAELPRYAPFAAKVPWLINLRNRSRLLKNITEPITGMSRRRNLPEWRRDFYNPPTAQGPENGRPVILFADTFNTYFEPENLVAATRVLNAAGYRVLDVRGGGKRPLCCGRTYLTSGMVDKAREEIERTLQALEPYIRNGIPVVGLEPSCMLGIKDEWPVFIKSDIVDLITDNSYLFEEFLVKESPGLDLNPMPGKVLLHVHCHQKAHNKVTATEQVLGWIPQLSVVKLESTCCGMAGSFGYAKDTADISRRIAELDLKPKSSEHKDALFVAQGTSCRHQFELEVKTGAMHVARVLQNALKTA